jgi:hypothetical protein
MQGDKIWRFSLTYRATLYFERVFNTEDAQNVGTYFFFHGNSDASFLAKNRLGYILGDFSQI